LTDKPKHHLAVSAGARNITRFRVRYSETDQMGTFYNARALEWFECGRTELLRQLGLPYSSIEARGMFLPLVEAHVEFLGRARYDDLLEMTTSAQLFGRARLRSEVAIIQAESGTPVARGYTVHAFTDAQGKPIRPPCWFTEVLEKVASRL
jgi:acyl-CoA thioester hydrolase